MVPTQVKRSINISPLMPMRTRTSGAPGRVNTSFIRAFAVNDTRRKSTGQKIFPPSYRSFVKDQHKSAYVQKLVGATFVGHLFPTSLRHLMCFLLISNWLPLFIVLSPSPETAMSDLIVFLCVVERICSSTTHNDKLSRMPAPPQVSTLFVSWMSPWLPRLHMASTTSELNSTLW